MLLDNQKMSSYINFESWTADQVAEWLRGLDMDDAIIPYVHYFLNANIDGRKLLLLTHSDLERLNVLKLGHQELILEAVDLLRNLCYGHETENLQSLALRLGCKARGLNGELRRFDSENDKNRANVSHHHDLHHHHHHKKLSIGILSTVADLIGTLKSLVAWMDKPPFCGFHDLCLVRNTVVKLGLDLISFCQRESSIPANELQQRMTTTTTMLSDICEELVIGSPERPLDPLYVQPASLELATIRKKQGEELGLHILSSYYGIHLISGVKDMSPADLCGKIEKDDEVIQVNYQTVVGWQLKKLVNNLKEKPKEVILLLKKRPRHVSPFGQMQNKNKQNLMAKHAVQTCSTLPKSLKKLRSRDGESKQQRPMLQELVSSAQDGSDDQYSPKEATDGNDTDNEVFRSGSESPQFTLPVHVDPKQRRATVSGGSPTLSRPLLVIEDLDTPTRPKSFTIEGSTANMPTEIVINSPDNDVASELHKFASAIEKRHEFKQTKSTPSSLEFNVKKPTPKVMEPKTSPGPARPLQETKITVKSPDSDSDSPPRESEVETPRGKEDGTGQAVGASEPEKGEKRSPDREVREKQSPGQQSSGIHSPERQSPEHTLDSSTDSVPPSLESSIESSQTCTSSLESSSLSPPLDDSASSEKEGSDTVFESTYQKTYPQAMVVPQAVRTPPARRAPQHAEVAGSHFDKNEPQLVAIRKIDSVRLPDLDVEKSGGQGVEKRHVTFGGKEADRNSDSEQCYTHIVVGGKVQRIPANSPSGGMQSRDSCVQREISSSITLLHTGTIKVQSPSVLRRPKPARKRVDRRVSCKDLGKGDCEGWLYKRRDKGHGIFHKSHWKRHWCVLKDLNFFYYKDDEALKAEGVLHLPAFQVSPVDASEMGTKKFAFKIHNLGTSFYFASERQDDMSKWMNRLQLAAISYKDTVGGFKKPEQRAEEYYSESEDDDEDNNSRGSSRCSTPSNLSFEVQSPAHPHGAEVGSAGLKLPASDLSASQTDITKLMRRISNEGVDIVDGKDKNARRRTALICKGLEEVESPELLKLKRLKSLQRTLKDKEKELEDIQSALSENSLERLLTFRERFTPQTSPVKESNGDSE